MSSRLPSGPALATRWWLTGAVLAWLAVGPIAAADPNPVWTSTVQSRIEAQWRRPPAKADDYCRLQVGLTTSGLVASATVVEAHGQAAFADSLVTAAFKTSVAPVPVGAERRLELCFAADASACGATGQAKPASSARIAAAVIPPPSPVAPATAPASAPATAAIALEPKEPLRAAMRRFSELPDAQIGPMMTALGVPADSPTGLAFMRRVKAMLGQTAVQDRLIEAATAEQLAALSAGRVSADALSGFLLGQRSARFDLTPVEQIPALFTVLAKIYDGASEAQCMAMMSGRDDAIKPLLEVADRLPVAAQQQFVEVLSIPVSSPTLPPPPPVTENQRALMLLALRRYMDRLPDEDNLRLSESLRKGQSDCWTLARLMEGILTAKPDVQRWWLNSVFSASRRR